MWQITVLITSNWKTLKYETLLELYFNHPVFCLWQQKWREVYEVPDFSLWGQLWEVKEVSEIVSFFTIHFLYEGVWVCATWIVAWGWPWPRVKAVIWQCTKTFTSVRINDVPICICPQWQDVWHSETKGEGLSLDWAEVWRRGEQLITGVPFCLLIGAPLCTTALGNPREEWAEETGFSTAFYPSTLCQEHSIS